MHIILLAGAPGSGKSTQGSALMAKNPQIKHISLGEAVREITKNPQHELAIKYQDLINSGNLLPDEVILEILQTELYKYQDTNKIILLDGYPRTQEQYEAFKSNWGLPAGMIQLQLDANTLSERMQERHTDRSDDNAQAIANRLKFYGKNTLPLLASIKADLADSALAIDTDESISLTSIRLYLHLQSIQNIRADLNNYFKKSDIKEAVDPKVKTISTVPLYYQLWRTGNEYQVIDAVQKSYTTHNFSFSSFGTKVVYLETEAEVRAILQASTSLGTVYRHFSLAAGLRYDFVSSNVHDQDVYRLQDNKVNFWKLIHKAFEHSIKNDSTQIPALIKKHLYPTFFAQKTFDLDTTFDTFFCSFWSEYLFGPKVSVDLYRETREQLLTVMRFCFYDNYYKGIDLTGLSSWWYSEQVATSLQQAKQKILGFINKASDDSFVRTFSKALHELNTEKELGLSEATLQEIVADNIFDLFFEPDFLENVMYEALATAIREQADLHIADERHRVYTQGMQRGFLYPIRSRILQESVQLADGYELPAGTYAYLNLKKAGIYHSAGARRCVGQAHTHYFRESFFDCLEPVVFNIKKVTLPEERKPKADNDNVPVSPERYTVSWHLRRDEAMKYMPYHNYKGNKFFDVLNLHQNTNLNALMVRQFMSKITNYLEKHKINIKDVVIASPEVRGIPIAAQVAERLQLPFYIIRKKGGYKMPVKDVCIESYAKGYGDEDALELPKAKLMELAGKLVVLIDDGLASGRSALACVQLLEHPMNNDYAAAKVIMVLSMLQHNYVKTAPKLSEHRLVKTLFDCEGGTIKEEEKVDLQDNYEMI